MTARHPAPVLISRNTVGIGKNLLQIIQRMRLIVRIHVSTGKFQRIGLLDKLVPVTIGRTDLRPIIGLFEVPKIGGMHLRVACEGSAQEETNNQQTGLHGESV
jgi:hypothetical protein